MQVLRAAESPTSDGAQDVRILAGSSVNLEQAMVEKRLREDLYYRLSAFTVYVPPLRQRRDEIPLLLQHFMHRLAKHYRMPHPRFSRGRDTSLSGPLLAGKSGRNGNFCASAS